MSAAWRCVVSGSMLARAWQTNVVSTRVARMALRGETGIISRMLIEKWASAPLMPGSRHGVEASCIYDIIFDIVGLPIARLLTSASQA